jgi:peptidoglycan hydrolase CwlO-like protein
MYDKLEHIESCIADYEERIKSNKELIKQYKKSLKKNGSSDFVVHKSDYFLFLNE